MIYGNFCFKIYFNNASVDLRISNKLVPQKGKHCLLVSLYHNMNITAYNTINNKIKQKTLGTTRNPLNTEPTA